MLTEENGILTQVQKAKEQTEMATEEEQRQLTTLEAAMNFKNTEYQGVTIPAGMAPTKIEGESKIEEGLVAIDKNGNEWVWIEVPKTAMPEESIIFENEIAYDDRDEEVCNRIATKLREYAGMYSYNNWLDVWYDGCGLGEKEYKETYQKMLKSIYINKGFWIGRYEAGIEGSIGTDKTCLNLARTESDKRTTNRNAICQKDAIPYNWVYCSESQILASQMTPDKSKTSSLMFGIQWDLVCKFLEEKSDLEVKDINSNSEEWGNYNKQVVKIDSKAAKSVELTCITEENWVQGNWNTITGVKPADKIILLSTGASEKTKILNIYDFAGNAFEWTLRKSSGYNNFSVYRGGCCGNTGNDGYASVEWTNAVGEGNCFFSFRPALY